MKNLALSLLALSAVSFASAQTATIEIGDRAPFHTYQMRNVDGSTLSIEDVVKENGVLVIFTCNTCPFVVGRKKTEGWEGRYNSIITLADSLGIGSILVNSNSAKRDGDDNVSAMKNRARDMEYAAPYVVDEESKLANGFGAKTTPHVFLFDGELDLIYTGAIDDNVDSAKEVEKHYLINAIERHAAGKRVRTNTTAPLGCSIKRVK
ncbi:MAG: thioredoxin family protein [Crocinitomicaceae bacterium]|nr:thioredoxin family protein [Crocinitomicaceae bacterium]|tara:strand:+ start:1087 stop:1707 length:621 start_codon:yes stop_codon:yes gene_type:complete